MDEKNRNRDAESFKDKLLNYGNQKSMEQYEEELRLERRRRAMESRKKKLAELAERAMAEETSSENADCDQEPENEEFTEKIAGRKGSGRYEKDYKKSHETDSENDSEIGQEDENDETDEVPSEEDYEEDASAEKRQGGFGLLRVAFIIIILLVAYAVFHSKCELKTVVVNGSNIYSEQEIWKLTTKGPQDMYAPFYAMTVAKDKGHGIPFIEKIDVDWKLSNPASVELTVYEKRIIGCVYAMGGYFYFDRDGLVCDYNDRRLDFVPLVEGLDFSSIIVGKKLAVQKDKYYDMLLNLTLLLEASELEVQDIRIQHDDSVILNIGQTEVRAGKRENFDVVVNALPRILSALENKNVVLKMENYSETNTTVVGSPKE